MNRTSLFALLATAAFGVAACGEKPNPDASAVVVPPEPAVTPAGATLPASPTTPDAETKTIVEEMALRNLYEVSAGNAAQARAKSEAVQAFAKKAVSDFTSLAKDLEPLATTVGVMPPTAMDQDHMAKLDALTKTAADGFDRAYLDQQETELTALLDHDKTYAATGSNDIIKAFVQKRAVTVAAHLAAVKVLKATVK